MLDSSSTGEEVVCHFQALSNPVAYLKFDHSGTLLFCACSEGQNFHIYQLIGDLYGSSHSGVRHLYVLHRGDTTAQVCLLLCMCILFTCQQIYIFITVNRYLGG